MFRRALARAPPLKEQFIVNFRNNDIGLSSLICRSDKDLGGFSTVDLSIVDKRPGTGGHPAAAPESVLLQTACPSPGDEPGVYGRFHGDLSLDLPEDNPDVVRLGYAMFRTKDKVASWLGLGSDEFYDWSSFSQIALRVRGDRRKYFVNLQADTPYPTDLYQHRLFLKSPGTWEVVTIPFSNFILTNGGVIQQQSPLDTEHIRSFGIGLIDGQYGPYRLDIDWVKIITGNYQPERISPEDQLLSEDVQVAPEASGPYAPGKQLPVD